jgi:hypothetical protein
VPPDLKNVTNLLFPQEKREDVIAKCVASEPKHGEVWQRIRKDPKNAYLSTKEVLLEVMNQLEAKEIIS